MGSGSDDIFQAVSAKDAAAVMAIIAGDAGAVHTHGLRGMTPLHLAAIRCDAHMAKVLLEAGADVDAQKDDDWTPLHHACQNGDVAVTRLLLERGADANARSKDGATPLHVAAVGISEMTAATLKVERSTTGAGLASPDPEVVTRLLIAAGSDVNCRKTSDGATPLVLAAYKGREGVARTLLEHGADINTRSSAGWAPLHVAAATGNERLVGLLIERGADLEASGKEGRRPREVIGMSANGLNQAARDRIAELLGPSQAGAAPRTIEEEAFEIEADSVEEARCRVPVGHVLVCEEVLSDGRPQTVHAAAETAESASRQARGLVPADAETLGEEMVAQPGERHMRVEAFSEPEARAKAQQSVHPADTVTDVKLETLGCKGFLGIGRRPNTYKVTVAQVAHVEVTFKTKTRIRGKLLDCQTASEFLTSIGQVREALARQNSGLPQDWNGPEFMVSHIVRMCFLGLTQEGKRFNNLLDRAKEWWPQDKALQSLAPLSVGTPVSPGPSDLLHKMSAAQTSVGKLQGIVQAQLRAMGVS